MLAESTLATIEAQVSLLEVVRYYDVPLKRRGSRYIGLCPKSDVHRFLEMLFTGKPNELYSLIWTLHDKRSYWFSQVQAAAQFVLDSKGRDIYVGVGLAARDYGPRNRCPSDEVAGICGFWADFDLKSDAHPKALPTTIEDALSLVPASFPPTLIIVSGNAVHAWWLFKEPWIFDTDGERAQAAGLISRFHTLLRYNSSQCGWAFDRLSDLARVLRIPGTINAKDPENPKQVTVHSVSQHRYNPSEFENYLDDLAIPKPELEQGTAKQCAEGLADKPLILDLNARIPQESLERWTAADLGFKNTWFRQRHDMPDQTQSGYDMALANFGVDAGLPEQEILDLFVHHRFLHKHKQRTTLDYFRRTISKAVKRCAGADVQVLPTRTDCEAPTDAFSCSARSNDHHFSDSTKQSGSSATLKAQICDRLSEILGIRIYRIVKITGSNPIYRMELEGAKIEFPRVSKLVTQVSLRYAIAGAVNKLFRPQKPNTWEKIAQMMLDAVIEQDGGQELELEGAARMYVSQYLSEVPVIHSIEGQTLQNSRKPMLYEGQIAVCSSDLQIYVNKTTFQNLSVISIAGMLSSLGAESTRVRGPKFKEQSRWLLPVMEFDPAEYPKFCIEDGGYGTD